MKIFRFTKKHSFFLGIIFFVVAVVAYFGVKVNSSRAALGFGGNVTSVSVCTCSDSLYITVGPPVGGAYVFTLGSILYAYYNLFGSAGFWDGNMVFPTWHPLPTGPWVLGSYTPELPGAEACWVVIPYGCLPIPSNGTINEVGTSMGAI